MNKNQYLIDVLKKLIKEIEAIRAKLPTLDPKPQNAISQPTQYLIDAVHADNNSKEKKDNSDSLVGARLNLPKAIRIYDDTEDRHKKWYADREYRLQILGVLAVIIYAGITACQWSVMRQTMVISNRAYMALGRMNIICDVCSTGTTPPPESAEDNNASISLYFINYGHSPARKIEFNVTIWTSDIGDDFEYREMVSKKPEPKNTTVQGSTDFPLQISEPTRAENILVARGQVPVGSSIGPKTPSPLFVYGHVSYTDVFNDRHTLVYCSRFKPANKTGPEGWGLCQQHNDEYDGPYIPPPPLPQK